MKFNIVSDFSPTGDQPQAIDQLVKTSRIDLICGNGFETRDTIPNEIPIEELMGD